MSVGALIDANMSARQQSAITHPHDVAHVEFESAPSVRAFGMLQGRLQFAHRAQGGFKASIVIAKFSNGARLPAHRPNIDPAFTSGWRQPKFPPISPRVSRLVPWIDIRKAGVTTISLNKKCADQSFLPIIRLPCSAMQAPKPPSQSRAHPPLSDRDLQRSGSRKSFEAALRSVRKFGGVLEHPEGSHAWRAFRTQHAATSWRMGDGGLAGRLDMLRRSGRLRTSSAQSHVALCVQSLAAYLEMGKSEGRFCPSGRDFHSTEERRRAIKTGACQRLSSASAPPLQSNSATCSFPSRGQPHDDQALFLQSADRRLHRCAISAADPVAAAPTPAAASTSAAAAAATAAESSSDYYR